MTEPLNDKQIDRLIAGYLAGSLSAAALPYFERWLRASPEHPRRVARLSVTDYCMHEVCQDTKSDYLLAALNQIEEAAGPAQLVTLHQLNASPWHRYRLHAVWGTIAAALLFAVVLTTVLLTSSDPSTPHATTDNTPTKPAESAPPILRDRTVATLTATHNAVWASPQAEGASAPGSSGSLTPGSKLHPNTRLTLTAGFAEITTHDGAIAILEAPATIEFTHNDNAIHLHAGKLVGLCYTESSKGFAVKTNHAEIIDLGTEFGVEVVGDQVTATVFTGEIEMTIPGGEPQPLSANQTARLAVDGNNRQFEIEDAVDPRFAGLLRPAIVTNVYVSLDGLEGEVVPRGAVEDARVLTDRFYEMNGIDASGLPDELLGGDLVRTPGDARKGISTDFMDLRIELELASPATLYLVWDTGRGSPDWLKRDYTQTTMRVGMDQTRKMNSPEGVGVGPGVSIDNVYEVWVRKQTAVGRVLAGEYSHTGLYYFCVVRAEELA